MSAPYATEMVVDRLGRKSVLTTAMLGGYEGHQLRIETSKLFDRPGVETEASVVVLNEGGFTHAFGLGNKLDGDFRKVWTRLNDLRATEKALQTQHANALLAFDAILAEARGHYVAKQARAEERSHG